MAEQLQIDAVLVVHVSAAFDADYKCFLVSPLLSELGGSSRLW